MKSLISKNDLRLNLYIFPKYTFLLKYISEVKQKLSKYILLLLNCSYSKNQWGTADLDDDK